MGLSVPNNALRGPAYPPRTLAAAIDYGQSRAVAIAVAASEQLFTPAPMISGKDAIWAAALVASATGGTIDAEGKLHSHTTSRRTKFLPQWASTWPGVHTLKASKFQLNDNFDACQGQMAGVSRCGHFSDHIKRYEDVFSRMFGSPHNTTEGPGGKKIRFVLIADMTQLSNVDSLRNLLNEVTFFRPHFITIFF
jgi:hypothetical protein